MDIWVISREISRDNGTVIGVTRSEDAAKHLAESDWANPDRGRGKAFGDWKRGVDGAWTADVNDLEYYQVQQFDLAEA